MQRPQNSDPFNLLRFVDAQAPIIDAVRTELRSGRKRSHWIWFIFPQIEGLGRSSVASFYAISGLAEAKAYLAHPLLGPRLIECTRLVLEITRHPISEVFGFPDDLKFRSSMTLFAAADRDISVFNEALSRYFGGEGDPLTLGRIR